MRQSKFTETQLLSILKEAERAALSTRSGGATAAVPQSTTRGTLHMGEGMEASDIKRLKALAHANSTLKRLSADMVVEMRH